MSWYETVHSVHALILTGEEAALGINKKEEAKKPNTAAPANRGQNNLELFSLDVPSVDIFL